MLNHAASVFVRTRLAGALLATTLLFSASVAIALEGIDLSTPAEPVADDECSRLIQIKYPFLSCTNGQIGLADGDETWENTRQIPQLGTWSESDGAYGPDQNQN